MGHSAIQRDAARLPIAGRMSLKPRPVGAPRYELRHGPADDIRKVVMLLEELGEPYRLVAGAAAGGSFLVDHDPAEGRNFTVSDPGAMLLYLAEISGRFLPTDAGGRARVTQWVMWLKMSEGGHFRHGANEASRLFGVLNTWLAEADFLAGDAYTIADMAAFVWVQALLGEAKVAEEFPHLARWFLRVGARPAVGRALRRH